MTVELVQTSDVDAVVIEHVVAEVLVQVARTRKASVEAAAVRVLVEREWARYDSARVRTFLPVLVLRAVVSEVVAGTSRRTGSLTEAIA